jgi:putative FmdB family regulatory protein
MPTYEYACSGCDATFERFLSISKCDDPQTCEFCGAPGRKLISMPNFILKGDDWTSKNLRVKGQMEEKNRRLDQKQNERKREAPGVKLMPNVGGEQVDSWSEAKKLAASKGKNPESYDAKIREEIAK